MHFKPVLIYEKETLSFEDVRSKIISGVKGLKSDDSTSSNSLLVVRDEAYRKKNHGMNIKCQECGKSGYVK